MTEFFEWAGQNPGLATLALAMSLLGIALVLDAIVKPGGGDE